MPDNLPDDILWHQSGVNKKGEPFIQLLRGTQIVCQMDVEQARDHARAITEAAEAAEQDAFLMDWGQRVVGLSFEKAGTLMMEFRQYRRERTGKNSGARTAQDWVMPTKQDDPSPDNGEPTSAGS